MLIHIFGFPRRDYGDNASWPEYKLKLHSVLGPRAPLEYLSSRCTYEEITSA